MAKKAPQRNGGLHLYSLRMPYKLWPDLQAQAQRLGVSANFFICECLMAILGDTNLVARVERRLNEQEDSKAEKA